MKQATFKEDITLKGKEILSHYRYSIVDSFIEGEYEFYLLHHKDIGIYQIGMQKTGMDFTDKSQLIGKKTSARGKGSIKAIKNKIDEWLNEYRRIYTASEDERKNAIWKRILTKLGYKVKTDYDRQLGEMGYISL